MMLYGILIGVLIGAIAAVPVVLVVARARTRRAIRAERAERQAARRAEFDAMTDGLAHGIKNPLSTVGLNAELLIESIEDLEVEADEKTRIINRIRTLSREVDRLRDILSDFLRFAGEMRLDRRDIDLNVLLDEMVDFYLPQSEHHGIKLRADLAPGKAIAHVDRGQLQQAILNLLINATQAMEGRTDGINEIYLRTRPIESEDGDETGWEIHVIDTGPGIPDETLAEMFNPYFTTKASGSGLGLPTTKRIIEEHGGRLDVHSVPGQGTDFSIVLPEGEGTGE